MHEDGPECYIPLSPDRLARSQAIWREAYELLEQEDGDSDG